MLDRWIPGYALTRFDYFVCGPPKLVSTVGVELRNRGVPTKRIHTERFEVV
jgi:ferredoxin-NADP reductase